MHGTSLIVVYGIPKFDVEDIGRMRVRCAISRRKLLSLCPGGVVEEYGGLEIFTEDM